MAFIVMSLSLLSRPAPLPHLESFRHLRLPLHLSHAYAHTASRRGDDIPNNAAWPGFANLPNPLQLHGASSLPTPLSPHLCTLIGPTFSAWNSFLTPRNQPESLPCRKPSPFPEFSPLDPHNPGPASIPSIPYCLCLLRDPSVPVPSVGREFLKGRSQFAFPWCPQQRYRTETQDLGWGLMDEQDGGLGGPAQPGSVQGRPPDSLLPPEQPLTGGRPQVWRPEACSSSTGSASTSLSLGR